VDLAGVNKDKIELTVVDQRLKLKGNRNVPLSPENDDPDGHTRGPKVHLMEIDHGSFAREVELPADVDHEKILATYRNGMLWVELPKK
jgi:HSP20 family protein